MKDMARKTHYKMYKSHKGWLVAGITVTSMAVGIFAESQNMQTAYASEETPTTETTSATKTTEGSSTVTLSTPKTDSTGSTDQSDESGTVPTTQAPVVESDNISDEDPTSGTGAGQVNDQSTKQDVVNQDNVKDQDSESNSNNAANGDVGDKEAGTETQNAAGTLEDKTTGDQAKSDQDGTDAVDGESNVDDPANTQADDATKKNDDQTLAANQKAAVEKAALVTPNKQAAQDDQTIDQWMPNKTLQEWVLKALNTSQYSTKPADVVLTSVDQITKADMLYLTEFHAQNYGTTYIDGVQSFSIEGLQYATNMKNLDLMNNINVAPHAMRGDVTDITPIASLTNLTDLQIGGSRVSDVTPISQLSKVTSLYIGLANIADFSSLNAAQYTRGIVVEQQFVENKVVYIPTTGKYEMVNPVKPPKGMTMTMAVSNGFGIPIYSTGWDNSTVRVFYTGATSTLSSDQSTLDYQVTKNQIMPGQTANPFAPYYNHVVLEDYTYWLTNGYSFTDGTNTISVAMVTPYVISAPAQTVTVNYVDEDNNALAAPTILDKGMQGQSFTVTAPVISGYVLVKPYNTATGTYTNQEQTINFVYKSAISDVKTVTEQIQYQDTQGKTVADSTTQTVTFATVTDPNTFVQTVYSKVGATTQPALDEQGRPDASWTVYTDGTPVTLAAVVNPTVTGMHVLSTTDPANDLTQTTAQTVTPETAAMNIVVTYAHDFTTTLNQVNEGITYVDQSGKPVADAVTKKVTFATVTDQSDGSQTLYSTVGDATTPELDLNGIPTGTAWTAYTAGTPLTLAAVMNPVITGMRVVATTDPANDLTQTTAQTITNASQNLAFTVTYAHDFTTTLNQVNEGITYVDQSGKSVADAVTKTITFATVTDQSNGTQTLYSTVGDVTTPELDLNGIPTGAGWTAYAAGDAVTLAAIANPVVKGMRVVATTDPANDLTQTTAQTITNASQDLTFTVTYAHDFETAVNQVTETITYVDESGKQVADPVTQTITFATVTDQSNQQQTVYSTPTAAQAPTLDENGHPTDAAWTVYVDGTKLTLAAVKNPTVSGFHVKSTTDPANDLTQTTAQDVTSTSQPLAFVVTYAADTTGGGDNGGNNGGDNNNNGGNNNGGDNNGGGTTTPGDNNNGSGDNGNNGGGTIVTPPTTPTNPGTAGSGDGADEGQKPTKPQQPLNGGSNDGLSATNGGAGATGAATSQAGRVTNLTAQHPATASQTHDLLSNDDHSNATRLPQTSDQAQDGTAVLGLAFLGTLLGALGLKKRRN